MKPYSEHPIPMYVHKHKLLLAFIFVFIVLIAGYSAGYRFGPGVSLNRIGTLTLTNLPAGAPIYIDNVLIRTTTATSSPKIELGRGSHSVIVGVPNDYPWNTLTTITSGKNTVVNPILIPERPNAIALTGNEKSIAIAAIASTTLPIIGKPLHLAGGCADVYVSNNQIIADPVTSTGCTPPPYLCTNNSCGSTIIMSPNTPLGGVFAYPGRQDALILKLGLVIYAISLDPRNPQYFAPILTGTNPVPGTLSDGTLVVNNNGAVYKVKL
jgi:hypothetical protein